MVFHTHTAPPPHIYLYVVYYFNAITVFVKFSFIRTEKIILREIAHFSRLIQQF